MNENLAKEERKKELKSIIASRYVNREFSLYDITHDRQDTDTEILKELVTEGFLFEESDSYREYIHVVYEYKMTFEKGILYFEHEKRGTASYNINTGAVTKNGKPSDSTLVRYFQSFVVRKSSYYDYSDNRKSIANDFRQLGEYGKFIMDTVFKEFYHYTRDEYRNLGKILPRLKEFETMYNWKKEGVSISVLTNLQPNILPKSYRELMKEHHVSINRDIVSRIKDNVESFKNTLTLLQEERVPEKCKVGRYGEGHTWAEILESNNFRGLIKEEGYDAKALLRYLFNYILPYETMPLDKALESLRDYAAMHRNMEITDFKRYPKYLTSKHDILAGEYESFKKTYKEDIFFGKVNQEFAFVKKIKIKDEEGEEIEKVKFLIEMPSKTDDLKEEGRKLSHCVGSYIERIIKGETQILFLREESGIPLITLEVREDVLIQARGLANRAPSTKEKQYIQEYAKEKKLLVRI